MTHNYSLFIWILTLCFYFASCTEDKKEPIKDFDDIVPKAKSTVNSESVHSVHRIDSSKIQFYSTIKNFKIDSVFEINRNFVPDRFNPAIKKKEVIYSKKDSIQFLYWRYKDTSDTKRAFFNLLDCFETPCKPIKLYEKKNVSKSSFVILEEKNNLVIIKGNNAINLDHWVKFLMDKKMVTQFDYIISQSGRSSVQWFDYTNSKIKEIRK